jgi:diguanylate cyclase (GGDEF)-like protein
MKSQITILIFACALPPAWVSATVPSTPATLTALAAIHALSNDQANKAIPVAFEATVTYYKKGDVDLFVQDGDIAIYVETTPMVDIVTGDRVLVRGKTRGSFRPEIMQGSATVLYHGVRAKPVPADFKQLIRAELDCRLVTVHAVVRSANHILDNGIKSLYLQVLMDGGNIDAEVLDTDGGDLSRLLDAEVELTGAAAGRFDSKNQMTGILLEVPSMSDLKILKSPRTRPGSLPVTSMDEVLKEYNIRDRTQRVRVEGTITYYQAGVALVLQNGSRSMWISTQFEKPLPVNQWASVTGFPDVRNGSLTLNRAAIQETGVRSPVTPLSASPTELASGVHAFDLVSVEGRLLMAVREAVQDEYVLVSGGHLFSAVYRHPERGLAIQPEPMVSLPIGSLVRMTGICALDNGYKFQGPMAFELLLRSSNDIAVVAPPSLLSVRNLVVLVGWLVVVILAIGARAWLIERRVRHQVASLAKFEQRRSLILEHINGTHPLAGILEEITRLVSFKLNGATCWCTTADGGRYGICPPEVTGIQTVHAEISARSGAPLGTIFCAFREPTKHGPDDAKTLGQAAELATLAIETRRLYSDLTHRSEFDLLTDVHNRFSLERRLDAAIEHDSAEPRFFGLIYIDLDEFKQVNDSYGHGAGDLYLQRAARRMQRQIRPADMFARLGGDEFAVLVSTARTEDDVMEIARRLSDCFKEPVEIDRHILTGTASFGVAFYPRDGVTKDSLFNAADANMYAAKRSKKIENSTMQNSHA